jgi:hypothetical protein
VHTWLACSSEPTRRLLRGAGRVSRHVRGWGPSRWALFLLRFPFGRAASVVCRRIAQISVTAKIIFKISFYVSNQLTFDQVIIKNYEYF